MHGFHGLVEVLLLLLAVTAIAGAARRYGLPGPILLVLAGVLASGVPGVPGYELDPGFVLVLVLPPLLYSAALTSSLQGFRQYRRPIGLLSVGYVLFGTLLVGFAAHALVPGLPLATALVLGAVVAPPDAVAASAVARRMGLPRKIMTILEGESLVNDATALTAYRVAVAAAVTGGFSLLEGAARFAWASAGGVAIGLLVAVVVVWVRRRLDDPVVENAVSLLTPFAAFLPAEEVGASGVLAVVVAGLLLGNRNPVVVGSAARMQTAAVWRMVDFVLEGVVFALIGLQLPRVLEALADNGRSAGELALSALAVVAVVVLGRFAWVFPATYLPPLLSRRVRAREGWPPWRGLVVVSWAGMRGVVSLAAAFAVPEVDEAGAPLPGRDLLLFLTFCVIAATLVVQGSTLAAVIRLVGVRQDPGQDRLSAAAAVETAASAALADLEEQLAREEEPLPPGVEERLRQVVEARRLRAWERLGRQDVETPSAAYRRLRVRMLGVERRTLVRLRDEGRIPDELLHEALRELDHEESLLTA
ncbi:Na+/H+ antiporter [Kineococcus glutinatus]|uniref:Na+/H+ antiporter n=1 Tax=Kineococcus glutinatus TaxID=1070872 RepID=A0ABP9H972_9ACTN